MSVGVEMLRRAAAQLRELVAVLPEGFDGPWHVTIFGLGNGMTAVGDVDRRNVIETHSEPTAEYLATLHPPVALAVAAWLEGAADSLEQLVAGVSASALAGDPRLVGWPEARFADAIWVARQILRVEDTAAEAPAPPVQRQLMDFIPPGEVWG